MEEPNWETRPSGLLVPNKARKNASSDGRLKLGRWRRPDWLQAAGTIAGAILAAIAIVVAVVALNSSDEMKSDAQRQNANLLTWTISSQSHDCRPDGFCAWDVQIENHAAVPFVDIDVVMIGFKEGSHRWVKDQHNQFVDGISNPWPYRGDSSTSLPGETSKIEDCQV